MEPTRSEWASADTTPYHVVSKPHHVQPNTVVTELCSPLSAPPVQQRRCFGMAQRGPRLWCACSLSRHASRMGAKEWECYFLSRGYVALAFAHGRRMIRQTVAPLTLPN